MIPIICLILSKFCEFRLLKLLESLFLSKTHGSSCRIILLLCLAGIPLHEESILLLTEFCLIRVQEVICRCSGVIIVALVTKAASVEAKTFV